MPQPIDMQTELGRTLMAERIQEASTRAALLAQQRELQEEKQLRGVDESRVGETAETQSEQVDEDGRQGHADGDRRRRSAARADDDLETPGRPVRKGPLPGDEHAFDVSV